MKKAEEYIRQLESSGILMNQQMTFPEYAEQLCKFQDIVCRMIAGSDYHDKMHVDEATFIMESAARKNGVRSDQRVHNGIQTMKRLEKELAVTMSGIQGERDVSRTLKYLNRPKTQIFRNVYLTDGQDETELDAVVLTDAGIILLEIKKVKTDIVFAEDGRMMRNGDVCYEKIPLGLKMKIKRRLLQKYLEDAVAEKSLDIPVHVDSLIVLSAPKGTYIHVKDNYRKEKYCFRTELNKRIESYLGHDYYKAEQLEQLGSILSELASNAKRFELELNYNDVRMSIAEALAIIQNNAPGTLENADENCNSAVNPVNKEPDVSNSQNPKLKSTRRYYIAASVACALLCCASTFVRMSLRHT